MTAVAILVILDVALVIALADALRSASRARERHAAARDRWREHRASIDAQADAIKAQVLRFHAESVIAIQAARQAGFVDGVAAGVREHFVRLSTVADARVVVTDVATGKPLRITPPMPRFSALVTVGQFVGNAGVTCEIIQEIMPSDPYIDVVSDNERSTQ